MADYVNTNQFVVCIWGTDNPPSNIEAYVAMLKEKAGDDGIVRVENASMLLKCKYNNFNIDEIQILFYSSLVFYQVECIGPTTST